MTKSQNSQINTFNDDFCSKKTGYQLKARIGLHCGSVSVGVASTFVLLGDDVELAWKMEQTGESLKIQASEAVLAKLSSVEGDVTKLFDFKMR